MHHKPGHFYFNQSNKSLYIPLLLEFLYNLNQVIRIKNDLYYCIVLAQGSTMTDLHNAKLW